MMVGLERGPGERRGGSTTKKMDGSRPHSPVRPLEVSASSSTAGLRQGRPISHTSVKKIEDDMPMATIGQSISSIT